MRRLLVMCFIASFMVGCASSTPKKGLNVADGDVILKRVAEADLSYGLVVQNTELNRK